MVDKHIVTALVIIAHFHACSALCDMENATAVINRFAAGIKSSNETLVCREMSRVNDTLSQLEVLTETCDLIHAYFDTALTLYFDTLLLAPNIAHLHGCYRPYRPAARSREGCSREELQGCTSVSRQLAQIVKNNPDPVTSHRAEMQQLCRIRENPELLDVCMEAHTRHCSTFLERYAMYKLYYSAKEKVRASLVVSTLDLDCDSLLGDKGHVQKCQKDYSLLRSTLFCSPHMLARVYSSQPLDWTSNQTCSGVSVSNFSTCVTQHASSCPAHFAAMTEVADKLEKTCLDQSIENVTIAPETLLHGISSNNGKGSSCFGLPPELGVVLREFLLHPGLRDWQVYGNNSGVSVILNFGNGYTPKPVSCKFGDC